MSLRADYQDRLDKGVLGSKCSTGNTQAATDQQPAVMCSHEE
jgi:hypothetical protein